MIQSCHDARDGVGLYVNSNSDRLINKGSRNSRSSTTPSIDSVAEGLLN